MAPVMDKCVNKGPFGQRGHMSFLQFQFMLFSISVSTFHAAECGEFSAERNLLTK